MPGARDLFGGFATPVEAACITALYAAFTQVVVPLIAPRIVPLGEHYGIEPIHLGVLFLANLELGFLTPPVGMNLFLASYRLGKPMSEVYRAVVPVLIVMVAAVLLITYVPCFSTWLPGLFAGP